MVWGRNVLDSKCIKVIMYKLDFYGIRGSTHKWTLIVETAVWPIPFLINVFTALEGSQVFFCFVFSSSFFFPAMNRSDRREMPLRLSQT